MELCDLHVHSTASDGTFTPTELVIEASKKGLRAFALTDHDTVSGVKEAVEAGNNYGIEVIPGIEISCSYSASDVFDKEIHIVGLFLEYEDEAFNEALEKQRNTRDNRNDIIIERMNKAGMPVTLSELKEKFGEDTVLTRAHFAAWMTDAGFVKDNNEAFDKYLGDSKPFFVPRERMDPYRAIKLIRDAGGIAILAHPILYNLSEAQLSTLCASLKRAGLTGIEALYSTYRNGDEIMIRRLAKNNGLLISGGSDFHGGNKPYIHLGIGRGNLKVPYEILTNLKNSRT